MAISLRKKPPDLASGNPWICTLLSLKHHDYDDDANHDYDDDVNHDYDDDDDDANAGNDDDLSER